MKANYPEALKAVLKHEGGFSNNPKDPGGATMKGVTQAVYDAYRKRRGLNVASVKGITQHELEGIYRDQYWNTVRGDELPSGVDYAVGDFAVNSGPGKAIEYLQSTLGVTADGVIGNVTLHAAETADVRKVINEICDRRLAFMKRIKHRQTGELLWKEFGNGWSSRVAGVRALAIDMAGRPTAKPTQPAPVPPPPDVEPVETLPPVKPPVAGKGVAAVVVAALLALIAAVAAWLGYTP